MDIEVFRYSSGKNDTLGLMFIDSDFQCYTLEDEYRSEKVFGETRIPAGCYALRVRDEGGFHNKYLKKFGDKFHKGMLELVDVPNFKYVLIHIGNNDDDTAGCLLVGDSANNNKVEDGFISNSTSAYKRIYPKIIDALLDGEEVNIIIKDF